jgi:SAM-dependent methyltransferase
MLARQRAKGLATEFVQADVTQPLPLARRFHAAICTLALMDVYAYQAAIRNISAILLDGGQFIVSLVHPSHFHDDDYFDAEKLRLHMGLAERGICVRYWQRPLEDYASALAAAGLCISQIKEPRPSPAAMARYPDQLAGRDKRPSFLVLQAIKRGKEAGRHSAPGD